MYRCAGREEEETSTKNTRKQEETAKEGGIFPTLKSSSFSSA